MSPEIAARLASLDIQLVAEAREYSMFMRADCLALVRRTEDGFLSPGSSGIMTENGLAYLVWREGRPLLVGKGAEAPAGPAQVAAIRRFSEDLKSALGVVG